ncbi:hypothetical protein BDW62DRAFT_171747 [Aspergillus aurantiobrunneus]
MDSDETEPSHARSSETSLEDPEWSRYWNVPRLVPRSGGMHEPTHIPLHHPWSTGNSEGDMLDTPGRPWIFPSSPVSRSTPAPGSAIGARFERSVLVGDLEECDYTGPFETKGHLKRHATPHHIRTGVYACPVAGCQWSFYKKDNLQDHVRRVHPTSKDTQHPTDKGGRAKSLAPDQSGRYFRSNWDLPHALADIPENDRLTFLLESITLTATKKGVKVLTCKDFVREKYGEAGIELVTKVVKALEHDDSTKTAEHFWIRASKDRVSGRFYPVARCLWELLRWLCLTFRRPKKGTISLSTCKSGRVEVGLQQLYPAMPDNKCCWFSLFDSAVIAAEAQTSIDQEMLLETEFHLMLQLAAVEYPVLVDKGLILMGYSTALVPVRLFDDETVLWHLETASHDSQLKVTELTSIKGSWLKTPKLEDLQSKKALVGWCPEAITLLGTGQLNTPQWSNARTKKTTWSLKGGNLQFIATSTAPLQLGGQAGFTFDRAINTLRFNATSNYLKCLNSSAKDQIVLYDVTECRAWLVPLICVFHEMLLAYWRRIPSQYRHPDIPLASPMSNGAAATLAALRDSGSLTVEGAMEDRLTIRDLILGFSTNLSRATVQRPGRTEIYGYEFMDITMDARKGELKRKQISKEGLLWISLLEHVNCLFCCGIGDVIRGSKADIKDSPCNRLPKGHDWLAASMHSIEELNSRHGGNCAAGARRLSSQHYWFMTGSPFQKCDHIQGSQVSCWSSNPLLQNITTRPISLQQEYKHPEHCGDGAVVFGRHKRTTMFRIRLPFPEQDSSSLTLPKSTNRKPELAFTISSNDLI